MNHKPVYRTAPASPGLLNICIMPGHQNKTLGNVFFLFFSLYFILFMFSYADWLANKWYSTIFLMVCFFKGVFLPELFPGLSVLDDQTVQGAKVKEGMLNGRYWSSAFNAQLFLPPLMEALFISDKLSDKLAPADILQNECFIQYLSKILHFFLLYIGKGCCRKT